MREYMDQDNSECGYIAICYAKYTEKMKFSTNDSLIKREQIHGKLHFCSHLLMGSSFFVQ